MSRLEARVGKSEEQTVLWLSCLIYKQRLEMLLREASDGTVQQVHFPGLVLTISLSERETSSSLSSARPKTGRSYGGVGLAVAFFPR